MAFKTKNGTVLLNPSERSVKFAKELKENRKRTNEMKFKLDENKKSIKLDEKERAFRAGYLEARKDSSKAYKANKNKKQNKGK